MVQSRAVLKRSLSAECVSKVCVLLSTLTAVAFDATLASSGWAPLWAWTVGVFVAAVVTGRRSDLPVSLLFSVLYLLPTIYILAVGRFDIQYMMPWVAGLLGVIIASGRMTSWSLPRPWRWALVVWALLVGASWPVVVARELDFSISLLNADVPNSALGGSPGVVVQWIAGVAVLHMVGILWLDWSFGHFNRGDVRRFERAVIVPIGISWLIAACVGVYQTLFDITFLNHTFWAVLRRAPGTMADANPFGIASALWGVLIVAAFWSPRSRLSRSLIVLLGLSWVAVWGSGSRSSLLVSIAFCAYWLYVELRRRDPIKPGKLPLAVGALALAFGFVWVAWGTDRVTGPLRRIAEFQPRASMAWASSFVNQLWDRTSYGGLALKMIRDFPLTGVGLGSYHTLISSYSALYEGRYLPPDNAQNWYRHELAELGFLGSIGWIAWCAAFASSVWKQRPVLRQVPLARIVLGSIFLLAAISLVGMPTQNMAMAMTFSVLVFWYAALTDQTLGKTDRIAPWKPWTWVVLWGIVGAFVLSTGYVAWEKLRVPYRAEKEGGWRYRYGFHDAERPPDAGSFSWTGEKAVDVFPVQGPWLKLTLRGIVPPDVMQHPIKIRIWRDHDRILRIVRRDESVVTRYVKAPSPPTLMMIEIQVDRTWRPSDFGSNDSRELGVAIDDWTFVNTPPPNAIVIN